MSLPTAPAHAGTPPIDTLLTDDTPAPERGPRDVDLSSRRRLALEDPDEIFDDDEDEDELFDEDEEDDDYLDDDEEEEDELFDDEEDDDLFDDDDDDAPFDDDDE